MTYILPEFLNRKHEDVIIVIVGIGLIGIACQWIAWRVKLPAILFLLIAGIAASPVSG